MTAGTDSRYHVIKSTYEELWTVGTGTLGVDWNPVADFGSYIEALEYAGELNNPGLHQRLDRLEATLQQIEASLARLREMG